MRTLDDKHHMWCKLQALAVELALAGLEIICGQFHLLARQYACQRLVEIGQVNGVQRFEIIIAVGLARCMRAVDEIVIERNCVRCETASEQLDA